MSVTVTAAKFHKGSLAYYFKFLLWSLSVTLQAQFQCFSSDINLNGDYSHYYGPRCEALVRLLGGGAESRFGFFLKLAKK